MLDLTTLTCSLSPLTIWLRWEQAGSGGSGFPGNGGTSFAGSALQAADPASQVGEKLALVGASW